MCIYCLLKYFTPVQNTSCAVQWMYDRVEFSLLEGRLIIFASLIIRLWLLAVKNKRSCSWYSRHSWNVLKLRVVYVACEISFIKVDTKRFVTCNKSDSHWKVKWIGYVKSLEIVSEFLLLGSPLSKDGNSKKEIERRMTQGRSTMTGLINIWKNPPVIPL